VGQRSRIGCDRANPGKIACPATDGFFVFQVICVIFACVTFSPALTLHLFERATGDLASRVEAPRRRR
jgi:hypothetical protein